MFKIKIIQPKKTKEAWLDSALQEYDKRIRPYVCIEWVYTKNSLELEALAQKESVYFCLDSQGKEYNSKEFSEEIFSLFEKGGSRLTFVIGPDTGLSKSLLESSRKTISLSKMTFTHQMVRLVLIEQIYRAFMIRNRSPYHK